MQEISQSEPQPQTPPVSPTPPAPQPKNLLVLIMSVLLIVTVAIAGLFYFQIQKLSKELSKYQVQLSPTPTATTDPTANWKTYNHDKCGNFPDKLPFSYKIPPTWKESTEESASCCTTYVYTDPKMIFKITCGNGFGGGGCGLTNALIQDKFEVGGKTISSCLEKTKDTGKLSLRLTYLNPNKDPHNKPGISFEAEGEDVPENRQFINQILSTFKFITDFKNTP